MEKFLRLKEFWVVIESGVPKPKKALLLPTKKKRN